MSVEHYKSDPAKANICAVLKKNQVWVLFLSGTPLVNFIRQRICRTARWQKSGAAAFWGKLNVAVQWFLGLSERVLSGERSSLHNLMMCRSNEQKMRQVILSAPDKTKIFAPALLKRFKKIRSPTHRIATTSRPQPNHPREQETLLGHILYSFVVARKIE